MSGPDDEVAKSEVSRTVSMPVSDAGAPAGAPVAPVAPIGAPQSNKYKPRLGTIGKQLSDATYVLGIGIVRQLFARRS